MSRQPFFTSLLLLLACSDSATIPLELEHPPQLTQSPDAALLQAPVFGLGASPDGGIFVAGAAIGITELRKEGAAAVAALPGATAVAAIGRGSLLALTGGAGPAGSEQPEPAQKLYRISQGHLEPIADLGAFEEAVNPDAAYGPVPNSNPFDLAIVPGGVLVADAAGNDILTVDASGRIDWVALLTRQPNPLPFGPPLVEPVATSVAVGPDGAYYAGELTGFPSPAGLSRVWRIESGSRHVTCPSDACTIVADGFTSIMDITFGPDGTLYVVEFDEAGWFAVEQAGSAPVAGGTVNACDISTGACTEVATGLSLPTAITVDARGRVWVAENSGLSGTAHVHPLP